MKAMLGCALAVGLVAAAAADDKKDLPIDGKKLVGKWEPKEAKKEVTMVLEFTKDQKTLLTVTAKGRTEKAEGTYKLDGNKLKIKIKLGEREVDQELAVLRLTDQELETEDSKGKKETLTRVRAKQ